MAQVKTEYLITSHLILFFLIHLQKFVHSFVWSLQFFVLLAVTYLLLFFPFFTNFVFFLHLLVVIFLFLLIFFSLLLLFLLFTTLWLLRFLHICLLLVIQFFFIVLETLRFLRSFSFLLFVEDHLSNLFCSFTFTCFVTMRSIFKDFCHTEKEIGISIMAYAEHLMSIRHLLVRFSSS